MKFINEKDKVLYDAEVKASGLNEFEFIKKRRERVKVLKDFRKSQNQKANWRKNRWKIMKGIKAFAKSTEGKKFHRKLGTFLATRDFGGLRYNEALELIPIISSVLTHTFIELDYWRSFDEEVEYGVFSDEVLEECLGIMNKIKDFNSSVQGVCLLGDHEDFLLRLCETNALVVSFAKKYGKSEKEIEKLWNDTKEIVKANYNVTEKDDRFYQLLVGILKKRLGKG